MSTDQELDFIKRHQKDNSILLLATIDGQIAGCLNITCGETARTAHVGTLGVSVVRKRRGAGIGSVLMRSAVDWAREHPTLRRLQLEVFSANEAQRLYNRLGFEEEGRRRAAYNWHGQPFDAVVMALLFEK